MEKPMEAIKKRESIRTYDPARTVCAKDRARLEACMLENSVGPLGNAVRFKLLDLETLNGDELRQTGTYGVIRGASLYLLGAVPDCDGALEDLGYCMERIILESAAMGLGTCWLAGTFRRSAFVKQMGLTEGELLPAISPVGYAAAKKSILERIMKRGVGSRRRKPWSELFFGSDGQTPLSIKEAGSCGEALESVRLGPSALNCQPWRIIKDREGLFHFYLQERRIYNRALGKIRIQNIDMGIAMCHFSLVTMENGLSGRWVKEAQSRQFPGMTYIASWQEVSGD